MSELENGLDIQELLSTGEILSLRVKSETEGLNVPEYLKEEPVFYLEIGYNMAVPIPDLVLTEQGISCTLSFNRVPYSCFIPVEAISGVGGPAVDAVLGPMPEPKPKKRERPPWLKVIK